MCEATDDSLPGRYSDTSKWLLTYLVYQVFRRPELKKRLQAELDEAMPNGDTCLSYETASNLELLNATVKELLRFHAPVPGPLPRYVPEGGDLLVDGKYVLPAGTQVALQPYTVHRDRDIFGEDADEFNPDRWLVSNRLLCFARAMGSFLIPIQTLSA